MKGQQGDVVAEAIPVVGPQPRRRVRMRRRLDAAHEAGLQEGLRMYRSMFERGSLGQLIVDFSVFNIERVNQALCTLTGYSADELIGGPVAKIFPADQNPTLDAIARLADGTVDGYSAERVLQHKSGRIFPILSTVSAVRDESGRPIHALVLMQDLSEQHEVKQAQRRSQALIEAAVTALPIVFSTFDAGFRLTFVAGGRGLVGKHLEQFVGKHISEITADPDAVAALEDAMTGSESTTRTVVNGDTYLTLNAPMRDDTGAVTGVISVSSNITAEVSAEDERRHADELRLYAVRHDPLTGLLARSGLVEHLNDLAAAPTPIGALILVDLDDFNLVNDSLGHDVGDAVLRQLAARISQAFPGATIAKYGGDEFAIVAPFVVDRESAVIAARRVFDAVDGDIDAAGHTVRVTASIGIAFERTGEAIPVPTLVRNADSALSHAKSDGPGQYRLYDDVMRREVRHRLEVQDGLRRAMDADELDVAYQPIVELGNRRIVGAEALLRWTHREYGPIPPGDFIPIAEQSGLIVPLGQWVMHRACSTMVALHGRHGTYIAVNVSVRQLVGDLFAGWVEDTLEAAGLPPGALVVEVTETALMDDIGTVQSAFHRLRSQGVMVAIDDFGTGYSSLARLQHLPVDLIKLDRAFVTEVNVRPEARAMADAILQISAAIGARIIAEGVETEAEAATLRELGYTLGQGYLFGRPMPFAALSARLGDRPGTMSSGLRSAG